MSTKEPITRQVIVARAFKTLLHSLVLNPDSKSDCSLHMIKAPPQNHGRPTRRGNLDPGRFGNRYESKANPSMCARSE